MELNVFVEPIGPHTFQASITQPLAIVAQGATKEDAVAQVQEMAQRRLRSGEIVSVQVEGVADHPWLRFAGIWKDDPDFRKFQANIREYRKAAEEAEANQ